MAALPIIEMSKSKFYELIVHLTLLFPIVTWTHLCTKLSCTNRVDIARQLMTEESVEIFLDASDPTKEWLLRNIDEVIRNDLLTISRNYSFGKVISLVLPHRNE